MARMARDSKLGYGYTLVGIGVAYILDKVFGPVVAMVIAGAFTVMGIAFLAAGHLHREPGEEQFRLPKFSWLTWKHAIALGIVMIVSTVGIYVWRFVRIPSVSAWQQPHKGLLLPPEWSLVKPKNLPQIPPSAQVHRPKPNANPVQPAAPAQQSVAEKPDILLGLLSPKEFTVSMVNNSNVVLRDPKYELGIADLDINEGEFPTIIPIPVSSGDWIRPHESVGPNLIFTPQMKATVKPGHRLFGFAMVLCPECKLNRCYWIYAVFGQDGWYSALPDGYCPTTSKLMDVMKAVRDQGDTYLNSIVPPEARTPIGQLAPAR